jgi:hypothetical protein
MKMKNKLTTIKISMPINLFKQIERQRIKDGFGEYEQTAYYIILLQQGLKCKTKL